MRWYLRLHPGWLAGVLCACWQRRIVLWLFARPAIYAMMCVGGGYGAVVGVMALLPSASEQAEPIHGVMGTPSDAISDSGYSFGPFDGSSSMAINVPSDMPIPSGDCSRATGEGQFCLDSDDRAIYVGNGSEAIRLRIGAAGPVLETVGIETKSIPLPLDSFMVKNSECVRNLDDPKIDFASGLTCLNDVGAFLLGSVQTGDDFDGQHISIKTTIGTDSQFPKGEIVLDWRGLCLQGEPLEYWPFSTFDGQSSIELDLLSKGDVAMGQTGYIPLEGCADGGSKTLYLKAEIDTERTSTPDMENQHFIGFSIDYGVR